MTKILIDRSTVEQALEALETPIHEQSFMQKQNAITNLRARYAVVVHPGTLWQEVDQYCSTLQNAIRWQMDCFPQGEGVPTDVMRVLPDGTLTTEL